jgi:hypothetical protein
MESTSDRCAGGEVALQQQPGGMKNVLIVVDNQDAAVESWAGRGHVRKRTGVRLPVRQRTVAGQGDIYPFEFKWENVGIGLA